MRLSCSAKLFKLRSVYVSVFGRRRRAKQKIDWNQKMLSYTSYTIWLGSRFYNVILMSLGAFYVYSYDTALESLQTANIYILFYSVYTHRCMIQWSEFIRSSSSSHFVLSCLSNNNTLMCMHILLLLRWFDGRQCDFAWNNSQSGSTMQSMQREPSKCWMLLGIDTQYYYSRRHDAEKQRSTIIA